MRVPTALWSNHSADWGGVGGMGTAGWLRQNMKHGFYQRMEAAPINTRLSPSSYEELHGNNIFTELIAK